MGKVDLGMMARLGLPMPSAKEAVLRNLPEIVRLRAAGWEWRAVAGWLYESGTAFTVSTVDGMEAKPIGRATLRDYVLAACPPGTEDGRAVRGRFTAAAAPKAVVHASADTPVAAPRPQAKPATVSPPGRKVPAAKGMLSASDLAPKGPSEGDLILKELGISDEIKVEDVVKSAGLFGLPGVEDPAPETGETDVDEQDVEIRGPSDGFCDMPEGIEFDDGDVPPPPSDDDAADALAGLLE